MPSGPTACEILADLVAFDTVSTRSNLALAGYIESHVADLGQLEAGTGFVRRLIRPLAV
jgi:hypothetical protein